MRAQNKTRKLGCPFPLCVTSELGTKYIDERLFGEAGNLRKEGKLNDKLQTEIKAEYEKQKKEIRKRLNEQFPYKFQDEPEKEEQPEDDKPKPDINKLFNHVNQLLMNDEFLEDYFMIFQKHKDRVIIEISVDKS